VSLIPYEVAASASEAENALRNLRSEILPQAAARWDDDSNWFEALHGVGDAVGDVLVATARLADHQAKWTKDILPRVRAGGQRSVLDLNEYLDRGRADLRSFLLLTDVLLDDVAKVLCLRGAPRKKTSSFRALVEHLESDPETPWSSGLRQLASNLNAIQQSVGYFRDKFVAHRDVRPVTAVYLPDGGIRLQFLAGQEREELRRQGGVEAAELLGTSDEPLDAQHDMRIEIALAGLRVAEPEQRRRLAAFLTKYGAISPDPFQTAVDVADAIADMFRAVCGSDEAG
jgi:hypothetical protein